MMSEGWPLGLDSGFNRRDMSEAGSPDTPQGPFFVGYKEGNMDEDFEVYETLGHALGNMEVPEVKEGYYRLFDGAARRAELGRSERHGWDVFIKGWSLAEAEELNSALRAYLVRNGQRAPDEETDFAAFVKESASIMRRLQEALKPRWIRAIGQSIQWVRRRTG